MERATLIERTDKLQVMIGPGAVFLKDLQKAEDVESPSSEKCPSFGDKHCPRTCPQTPCEYFSTIPMEDRREFVEAAAKKQYKSVKDVSNCINRGEPECPDKNCTSDCGRYEPKIESTAA